MAYVKQTFVDNVTPLDAEHFNYMENGIATLDSEKLDKSELEAAVESALASAKESGGFNGEPGADGVGIRSVVQTTVSTEDGGENVITVTQTDGSASAFSVRNGSKGNPGEPGSDGKTPVKGTDYFTDADIAEMVGQTKAALASETWTFTLADGSAVTKSVVIK